MVQNLPARVLLVVGGLVLALPANDMFLPYSHTEINLTAAAITAVGFALGWLGRRRPAAAPVVTPG